MARNVVDGWTVPGFTHVQELDGGTGGRVMLALDDLTQTKVAIKYLDPRLDGDEAYLSRLRGFARSLSQLEDPNVVDFYELVESPEGTAIVMERVDGFGLRRLIATQGSTGPLAALAVLSGTLLGLAAAHSKGVVHGALRPSEILLDDDGNCRLTDFGLAPAGTEAQAAPAYAAPELWGGGAPPSVGTDLYAAIAIFYECLTGTQPYTGRNQAAIGKAHREAPVPVEAIPGPLRGLITSGLAKDPADRPASAADLLGAVEDAAVDAYGPSWLAQGRGRLIELTADTAQKPEPARPKAPKGRPPAAKTAAPSGTGGGGKGKVLAAALAVLVVAGGVTGGVLFLGGDGDPAPPEPANRGTPSPAVPAAQADPAAAALAQRVSQATAQVPGASFNYKQTGCCGGQANVRGMFVQVPNGSPSYNMTLSGSGNTRRSAKTLLVGDVLYVRAGKKWQQAPIGGQTAGYPGLAARTRWASGVATVTALLQASDSFSKDEKQVYWGTAPIDRLAQVPSVGALYAELGRTTGAQRVKFALKIDRTGRPAHLWFRAEGPDKKRAQVVSTTYTGWGRKAPITAPDTTR
ncbi:serine/threonine-protein kinase [Spirillospora sp. NPDC029432]|uniref:serine/threonine-protein kinase n=1 Tax=Spirillospora sp. NPDC029432 TaxID=3154599 RepID=UPI003454CB47